MSLESFIAGRYLRAKQKQAFISLITVLSIAGVTVGVMALIIVIAVMSGFESDLKSRILGVESHAVIMRHGGPISDHRRVLEYVENVTGVEAATPIIFSQIMVRSSSGCRVRFERNRPGISGRVIKIFDKSALEKISAIRKASREETDLPETPESF
jgi:lipoprotein-releasing system permease protein